MGTGPPSPRAADRPQGRRAGKGARGGQLSGSGPEGARGARDGSLERGAPAAAAAGSARQLNGGGRGPCPAGTGSSSARQGGSGAAGPSVGPPRKHRAQTFPPPGAPLASASLLFVLFPETLRGPRASALPSRHRPPTRGASSRLKVTPPEPRQDARAPPGAPRGGSAPALARALPRARPAPRTPPPPPAGGDPAAGRSGPLTFEGPRLRLLAARHPTGGRRALPRCGPAGPRSSWPRAPRAPAPPRSSAAPAPAAAAAPAGLAAARAPRSARRRRRLHQTFPARDPHPQPQKKRGGAKKEIRKRKEKQLKKHFAGQGPRSRQTN